MARATESRNLFVIRFENPNLYSRTFARFDLIFKRARKEDWYARVDSNHRPFAPEAKDPMRVFKYLHAVSGRYVDRIPHSHLDAAGFIAITFFFPGLRCAAVTIFSDSRSNTSDTCWLGTCV